MARHFVQSLKSKVWIAAGALAFFIFAFGIGSYLLVSLFVENTLSTVVAEFIFLIIGVFIFGWRLSNEIVKPVEKVSLLAKSLERGVAVTIPRTSGSAETDELLQILHRTNRQMQTIVGLMERVSSGESDIALAPVEDADRLTRTFQKLLVKVTESVHAKRDLERLQTAVKHVSEEVNPVKNGTLDVEVVSDFVQTRPITDSFKFLLNQFNELVAHVRDDSKQAKTSAADVQKTIQQIIGTKESRVREMNQAKLTLKQIPQAVKKVSEELFTSAISAQQSIGKARIGSNTAQKNLNTVGELRQRMQEVVKRVGRLNERAQEIGKVSKTLEDLAQRTNMIALNASIQFAESNEKGQGRGFTVLAEEVKHLAARAANSNKQISTLHKSIAAEINEVENSLHESIGEVAELSKFAIETSNSLIILEKYVERFLNLQEKLVVYSGEQSIDTEKAFESFSAIVAETEKGIKDLRDAETLVGGFLGSIENLHFAVADYKLKAASKIKPPPAIETSYPAETLPKI